MNKNTRIMYKFARMYEYVQDMMTICREYSFDYETMLSDKFNRYAVGMCILQLGEQAAQIRDIDQELYADPEYSLKNIKGMRDRIAHGYADIDFLIVKNVLKNEVPLLEAKIQNLIPKEILENPYILHEIEFDDYINKDHNPEIEL